MIASFNGKTPRLANSAFISRTACIIGDVEVDEGAGIWPGAVIRADFGLTKIGRNSQIEDNCVLHSGGPMDIAENVIVGHGAVVHGLKVGKYTLIGCNAAISTDVEIGEFCLIAAGCAIAEGVKIPDRSFVAGVPGKIRGEVSQEYIDRMFYNVKTYADLAQQYKEHGL